MKKKVFKERYYGNNEVPVVENVDKALKEIKESAKQETKKKKSGK